MCVLDDIETLLAEKRKERVKTTSLILRDVTTIIHNDVNTSHFPDHRPHEDWIGLRSDSNLKIVSILDFAVGVDVDAEDNCFGTKVLSPDFEGTTLVHTNL